MNDKLELDVPVLLPDLPDAADACLDRLVSTLSKREGVERAHVICLDGDTPAALCIHFDAAKLPLPRLREMGKLGSDEDYSSHLGQQQSFLQVCPRSSLQDNAAQGDCLPRRMMRWPVYFL